MRPNWRVRVLGAGGTAALTLAVTLLANRPPVQRLVTDVVPVASRVTPPTRHGEGLLLMLGLTCAVMLLAMSPLYRPRPRRILDTVFLVERRVFVGVTALATVGYFDLTFRVPRSTLAVVASVLAVVFPVFFVALHRRPDRSGERAVVVGDDPQGIADAVGAGEVPVVGYVSPPGIAPPPASESPTDSGTATSPPESAPGAVGGGVPDGGTVGVGADRAATTAGVDRLGGLSQLVDVIDEYDVDTAVFAFSRPDRAEFFGLLGACHDRDVTAMVHRDHADVVLTAGGTEAGELVEIDLDPWDWEDYAVKRAFDVAFAGTALLALAPLVAVIAVAIKLDSEGPVLYSQERTAEFGDTFRVHKFRSMVEDAESDDGATLSAEDRGGVDPRVTRIGRVLRPTHLDEIPQLWSILRGDMSVVGPRPERPELDVDIETEDGVTEWRQRWFVKPGLTGLAQINDVTGYEPAEKLRYDVAYIRQQSFWFDLRIVARQVWQVLLDCRVLLSGADDRNRADEDSRRDD